MNKGNNLKPDIEKTKMTLIYLLYLFRCCAGLPAEGFEFMPVGYKI